MDPTWKKSRVAEVNLLLEEFREKFPFRSNPQSIDDLTPHDLWEKEKGNRDSFFYWLQYKLKESGHLFIGSKVVFENARDDIGDFKHPLRIVVDDTKSIHEKVDAAWEDIPFFGGDKHIAKKIVFCYNQDRVTPIFRTEELEHFVSQLGVEDRELEDLSLKTFGHAYESLTVGEKWELLNHVLLDLKSDYEEMNSWDNIFFSRFLYHTFAEGMPQRASEATGPSALPTTPLSKIGLLFAPKSHEEILYLFSILHRQIGFPYIVSIQTGYPDVTAMNEKGETKKIELEVLASQFNHDPKGCHYIVCWENDMDKRPQDYPETIALKDLF